jgi:hypothetical protein
LVPSYHYPTNINFGGTWDQADSFITNRAYDYVHVAAAYWALYRVARNYPSLVSTHTWQWYINQAVLTVQAMMGRSVGFNRDGLMGETVFRLLLDDLNREGLTANATFVEAQMRTRWTTWSTERFPFVPISFCVTHRSQSSGLDLKWHGIPQGKKECDEIRHDLILAG